ncbi:unnamed protein product, partial [marine sediment metagenome]
EKLIAVKNLNFQIKENEIVSIIGPSGCGKTSTLNAIAGFIKPFKGKISSSSDIGIVFQKFNLFFWKTVFENVALGLRNKKLDKTTANEIVNSLISEVGLKGFENNYPEELSVGMQQRVALARAFAAKPKLLLMDEPFGSLDYLNKIKMQQLLLKIWQKNKATVVFVTHDVDEAIMLSDRVLLMKNKKIQNEYLIPFSRPRNSEIRYDKSFQELKKSIHATY